MKYQEDLSHIRSMMENSSRFISLSGLSGIFAGVFALIGATIAYFILNNEDVNNFASHTKNYDASITLKLLIIAACVLILSVGFGLYFTYAKSKKKNLKIWNNTTKNVIINLLVPLVAGGIFCLGLVYHDLTVLIAPSMLLFYGLSLVNVSKYTFGDVKWLGYLEIILGLITLFFLGYGLLFWSLGFGILHIIYGVIMYKKYDKQ